MEVAGIDMTKVTLPSKLMTPDPPIINDAFLTGLGDNYSRISFEDKERIMHSHGHTLQEIWLLRSGKFARIADVIIYPVSTAQVELIVKLANEHNVVIIPYGGGTNVTKALMLDANEK
jgi:alkyldihydroxyacetonephosphate synthase